MAHKKTNKSWLSMTTTAILAGTLIVGGGVLASQSVIADTTITNPSTSESSTLPSTTADSSSEMSSSLTSSTSSTSSSSISDDTSSSTSDASSAAPSTPPTSTGEDDNTTTAQNPATVTFTPLTTPRYMQLNKAGALEVDLSTGTATSTKFTVGQQFEFVDQAQVNGITYYRTAANQAAGKALAVPASDLSELIYSAFSPNRYMVVNKTSIAKYDLNTGLATKTTVKKGTALVFADKVTINGVTYLRTASDKKAGLKIGIPTSALSELTYSAFSPNRYMVVNKTSVAKYDLNTGLATKTTVKKGTALVFADKVTINGGTYLRTASDKKAGLKIGIPASALSELSYSALSPAHYLVVKNSSVAKYDLNTGAKTKTTLKKGSALLFSDKVVINGVTYLRMSSDKKAGHKIGVRLSDLSEIAPIKMTPLWMKVAVTGAKAYNLKTLTVVKKTLTKGSFVKFSDKYVINGVTYLRTSYDKSKGLVQGVPLSKLTAITFSNMSKPCYLKLSKSGVYKIDVRTGQKIGKALGKGQILSFVQQIKVDGVTYLRVATDKKSGDFAAIPASSLAEVNGIQSMAGKKYYFRNGKTVSGFVKVGYQTYYFKPTMYTGWHTINGMSLNFRSSGTLVVSPPYLSQLDPRWAYDYIGPYSFASSGCAMTAATMIIRAYGTNVLPPQVGWTSHSLGGYNASHKGTSAADVIQILQYYGLHVKLLNSAAQIKSWLKQGLSVDLAVNIPGDTHSIVLTGYSNGATYVMDPYNDLFYGGWTNIDYLWANRDTDPADAGLIGRGVY